MRELSGETTDTVPMTVSLGLSETEVDVLEHLFTEFASALGLNGSAIFAQLRQGRSIGQALDLPQGTTELLYDRAYKWFAAGRADKAEPLFRALCILNSRDAHYQIGYAVCLRYRGNLVQARYAIERALTLSPDWPVARFHAVELFARLGDWERVEIELGLFETMAHDELPPQLLQEAARYRLALDLRLARRVNGGAA